MDVTASVPTRHALVPSSRLTRPDAGLSAVLSGYGPSNLPLPNLRQGFALPPVAVTPVSGASGSTSSRSGVGAGSGAGVGGRDASAVVKHVIGFAYAGGRQGLATGGGRTGGVGVLDRAGRLEVWANARGWIGSRAGSGGATPSPKALAAVTTRGGGTAAAVATAAEPTALRPPRAPTAQVGNPGKTGPLPLPAATATGSSIVVSVTVPQAGGGGSGGDGDVIVGCWPVVRVPECVSGTLPSPGQPLLLATAMRVVVEKEAIGSATRAQLAADEQRLEKWKQVRGARVLS